MSLLLLLNTHGLFSSQILQILATNSKTEQFHGTHYEMTVPSLRNLYNLIPHSPPGVVSFAGRGKTFFTSPKHSGWL
jgi:hypothetical protein